MTRAANKSNATGFAVLPDWVSAAFVAYSIELDNEFEHRMAHRTSADRKLGRRGPWLASVAMWATCLRFIPETGLTIGDLWKAAGVRTNLHGMRRWGYIGIDPMGGSEARAHTSPKSLITLTEPGRRAKAIWSELPATMEERWQARFGGEAVRELLTGLTELDRALAADLPDCLPILGPDLSCKASIRPLSDGATPDSPASRPLGDRSLYFLLARVLLAYAVEFESRSSMAMAITVNIVPHLSGGPRSREIASRAGVSTEGCEMALTTLRGRGMIKPRSRGGPVELTEKGHASIREWQRDLAELEEIWRSRHRDALERVASALVGMGMSTDVKDERVAEGLKPYPDGWRAKRPPIQLLPAFPMVLHRGGYPDGA